jgi:choice-of-anchor C domain-containing protein
MKRLLLGLCALGIAGIASAASFFNGGFEGTCPNVFGVGAGSTLIPGWTVSVGNIDWEGPPPNGWAPSEGSCSLDLVGGGAGGIGGIGQVFDTVPGATYQVLFDLAGNYGAAPVIKPLAVTVNGVTRQYTFDTTGKSQFNMGWTTKSFTFVAGGASSSIGFVSDVSPSGGSLNAGAALDNVQIVQLNAWGGSQIAPIVFDGHPTDLNVGLAGNAARFGYQTANSPCCESGTFRFVTTATTAGNVTVNYLYSGYHGTCQAFVLLQSEINGGLVGSPLVNATDPCAGQFPSAGFAASGRVTFAGLAPGDVYGFRMQGSNFDINGAIGGELIVTYGAEATSVALGTSANPAVVGGPVTFTATVTGNAPSGFVTFTQEGRELCRAIPLSGNVAQCTIPSWFSPPPDPRTIVAHYSGDSVNAGSVSPPLLQGATAANTVPTAPSIGTASIATGSQTATVTWAAPASNGGSPITGYTIISSPGGLTGSAGAGATSATVAGLSFGTAYTFTVTATNAAGISPSSNPSNSVTPLAFAPTLISTNEDAGGTFATVIGRVDPTLAGVSVQSFVVTSCNAGVAGGSATPVGAAVAPNLDGYVSASAAGVARGQFVALRLVQSGTPISALSGCLPSFGNNDFWTTAALIGADTSDAGSAALPDIIDAPGKARWYKFKVAAGQRISVSITGLPADYDLAVFKDIGAAFLAQLAPADAAALTKLSAEYAPSTFSPSTFSPSTFSPSTFSPSTFSPDAFAPSTFSPSTFSPSTFSPSTFSPSTFSPSTFSPSTFSPSTFSPSTFSPSTFSPSTFSPSTFSADIISTAFSSAQTRSLIGVSATAGTVNESVVVDSWNNSGYFYARVTGRNGAFSTSGQYQIAAAKTASSCTSVTDTAITVRSPAAGAGIQTVILTDSSSFAGYPAADVSLMSSRLTDLAASSNGVVIDVAASGYTRVQQLKAQALANPACPFAMNLVAEEIKGIVDSYRPNNSGLRFVVIAGGDDVIPFFRYPDESMLGAESGYVPPVTGPSDASLRGNFILSQDAYGSKTRISLRVTDFPVPGLAVGRLVKTPTEIVGMIDAALPNLVTVTTTVNGVPTPSAPLQPSTSLVTGYDFLADVAGRVATELQTATGGSTTTLVTANGVSPNDTRSFANGGPWTASDLRNALLDSGRHDVVFLAGHFSANSTLAADFATNLITSDLAASKTDFTNTIVFSAGCHAGYGIVNRDALTGVTFTLDWAQAFAQKKATLVAGTGYQYGDTDFIEYSERLYLNFARELRVGTGTVAIGDALVRAKIDYLAATPDIRGIHTKALLESTLYGLPMLGVNMPAGRPGPAVGASGGAINPGPPTSLGLRTAALSLAPPATTQHTQLTGDNTAIAGPLTTWLQGPDGVVANPSEPVLPLSVVNVTPTDPTIVLRGVGFNGGQYSDSRIVPLTGAAATEIRGVHVPFAAPNFFPNRTWTVNYFGALAANGGTSLLVTPAQHRGADVDAAGVLHSTLRQYSTLDLRLFYSSNRSQASLSDAPSIVTVDAHQNGGTVEFTAQVTGDPAAAIYQVWVVYTDGGGNWVPVDLVQCDPLALPAVCGATKDSQIWKGSATISSPAILYIVQAASGTGLVTFDDNRGAYYAFNGAAFTSTTQQAAAAAPTTLVFESSPSTAAYGDTVSVTAKLTSAGGVVAGGLVNVNIGGLGNAGITDANGRVSLSGTVSSAPGTGVPITASYAGSGTALLPSSAATSFSITKAASTLTPLAAGVGVTVTAPVVTGNTATQQPLAGQSVSFAFVNGALTQTLVVNTDTNGNATVPTAGLPAGSYAVTASFLPASVAGQDTYYAGASRPLAGFTMNAQSLAFTALPASPTTYAPPGTLNVTATLTGQNAGQPIAITSATPDVCTVAGSPTLPQATYIATIVRAGADCQLNADARGTSTFAPAHAAATITINKAAQTFASFTQPASPLTFAPPGTFAGAAAVATPNSGQVTTVTTDTPAACTVIDTPTATGASYTATIVAGGMDCKLSADIDGNNFYLPGHAVATISIVKASQAITITGLSSNCASPVKTYGDPSFTIGVTGGGSGQPVTFTSTGSVCSVSTPSGSTQVAIAAAGTCTITANQAGNALYNAAPAVTQCFTVNKAGQSVDNFAAIPTKTFGVDGPFTVSPNPTTSPAGLPVTLSAAGNCTIDKTTPPATVSLTGKGACTITASAPANANYQAVAPARSFNILGSPQTINFASLVDKALGAPPLQLTATASSGLPVTFSSQDTDVCILQGASTLKLLAPGICTITASQSAASSNYAAAPDVPRSFKVHLSGLAGLTGITTSGNNGLVDSFDSTPGLGGYAATKNALVNVLSDGTINLQGKVWGNVQSAAANVIVGNGGLVTGNVTAATTVSNSGSIAGVITQHQPLPAIDPPPLTACAPFAPATPAAWISGNYSYNAAKGDLTLTGQNTATLAAGTYCLNSITLSGNATLNVSGPVKIKLKDAVTASGNSAINSTLVPRNLQIESSYAGSNGVTMSGNATGYFTVYAPGTSVTLSGNAELFGSVVGKSFTGTGNGKVHYDVKTLDVWDTIFGF